ncbi:MAG: SDR family NAD(P)-dependent oxidoreductase [Christensenellales bacterium]|jgi:L-rhamnose 1-dehydrogenase
MVLKDKVAIVTGGSRNIGAAICEAMAKEGAKVVVNYIAPEEKNANALVEKIKAAGGEATAIMASVDDKDQVINLINSAVEKYGKLDFMINNAGVAQNMPFEETTEDLLDKTMSVNFKGCWYCTTEAAKVMIKQGHGGVIVSTASVCANLGTELLSAYCCSKAAIRSLMQSASVSLGKYGIRCNSVQPGTILTDLNREQYKTDHWLRQIKEWRSGLGRLGEPDELAGAYVFLCSDAAKYITGIEITVDGGMVCRWE